jgi:hypothetical protein
MVNANIDNVGKHSRIQKCNVKSGQLYKNSSKIPKGGNQNP